MTGRKPKYDDTIDGVRVRVYGTRTEHEVVFADGDIDDPDADVYVYPKTIPPADCARLARVEWKPS